MSIKRKPLKLNLQMFAEGEGGSNEDVEGTNDAGTPSDTFNPITSQADLDALTNKAVQKALANQRDKFEKDKTQAITDALNQEREYSKLSQREREEKERDNERIAFEKERDDFHYEKLVNDVKSDLINKELPPQFAEFLAVRGDAERSLVNVGDFKKAFDDAVSERVKKSLRQNEPGMGGNTGNATNAGTNLAKRTGAKINQKPF